MAAVAAELAAGSLTADAAAGELPPMGGGGGGDASQLVERHLTPHEVAARGGTRLVDVQVKVPGASTVLRPSLRLPGGEALRACELCTVSLGENVSLAF